VNDAQIGPKEVERGKVLLLAQPESFSASYIRRCLEFWGIPVITPAGSPSEAFAQMSAEDWLSIWACVAVDLGQALFADLSREARSVPFLFVGAVPGAWFPGPYSWLAPPFASFQVLEVLRDLATRPLMPPPHDPAP
jgi:hypothetical protein